MVTTIMGIMHGTPTWIWLLFGYLLYRGIQGLRPRTIPLSNLFIMPGIFLALSLQSIVSRLCDCFTLTIFFVYLFSLLLGIAAGWLLVRRMKISVDKKQHLIAMPGSVFMLILTLLIFGIKYFFGYMKATNPESMSSLSATSAFIGVSGAIAGITLGRMLHYLYLYKKAPYND